MELKDILTNYRYENRISQREFARRCNLSNSLISILEMGKNPQTGKKPTPDIDTYKKIASGMNITVHKLFQMIGDSEMVDLNQRNTILVTDSELMTKLLVNMDYDDYKTVMDIFEKTERKMKEKGEL